MRAGAASVEVLAADGYCSERRASRALAGMPMLPVVPVLSVLPLLLLPLGLLVDDLAPYPGRSDVEVTDLGAEERENRVFVTTWLGTEASEEALARLMSQGTPSFRVHAYRQFVELSGRVYLGPLLAHLGDPDPLNLGSDCDVFQVFVGDELLDIAWPRLNPEERRRVRAAIYQAPVHLSYRLEAAAEDPEPGAAVLEAAGRDPRLLAVLAERRFRPVLPLVVAALEGEALGDPWRRHWALNAIAVWPHPSLFGPFRRAAEALLRDENFADLEPLYRAAAAWPLRQALPFLERAFEPRELRSRHLILLARALEAHPQGAFDRLKWRLAAEGVANGPILCELSRKDPARLEALANRVMESATSSPWDSEFWTQVAEGRVCQRYGRTAF